MSRDKLNIAIVGLGFGKEFIPIYQKQPDTNMYAVCQRTREKLDEVGKHSRRRAPSERCARDVTEGDS